MNVPMRRVESLCLALILAAGCAILATGCAAAPPPIQEKPTPVKAVPAPPPAEPPAAPQTTDEITPETRPGEVDVIDPGGERGPVSLVEAAKAERERRAHAGPPVAVITDENVAKSTGQITFAEPKKPVVNAPAAAALEALKDEQHWRNRALDIRTRLREATDKVGELELSAAGWRRRFYAEEDPYFRDGKIKPEWDRVLAQLEENRNEVAATRKELDDFLEEGRRAGALPGWLREGGELEPVPEKPRNSPGTVDPEEPQIYEQKPPGEDAA